MIVAIHQPNFMPWLPFFDKMRRADVFILLGHCQYEKNNFQNRFFYRDHWQTMSIENVFGVLIVDSVYAWPEENWRQIKERLPDKKKFLSCLDHSIRKSLWGTNCDLIMHLAELLGIKTKIVVDTPTQLHGTERLVELCQQYGATKYLSGGGGSRTYLQVSQFTAAGIEVEFQDTEKCDKRHVLDILA